MTTKEQFGGMCMHAQVSLFVNRKWRNLKSLYCFGFQEDLCDSVSFISISYLLYESGQRSHPNLLCVSLQ